MRKNVEIAHENSCFNKAKDDERMFILLERDITTPDVIRFWIEKRIEAGKNNRGDAQIQEALGIAHAIERDRMKEQK